MEKNKISNIRIRKIKDKIFLVVIFFIAAISFLPLFFIFGNIFLKGISSVSLDFFIHNPKPVGEEGGGIANAIVGTFLLVVGASVFSVIPGVLSGLYIAEVNKKGKLASLIRLCADILQSVPSIVLGIVVYIWIVKPMGKFSALAGSIALGIMMFPVIIKTTEETVKMIPSSLRDASLALGVPYHLTLLKVILPAALNGIITGILLSVARVAGETAPLLFTAFGNPYMNFNILKPVNSLPLIIFNYAISPYEDWQKMAWGASLVLIVSVFLLNILTRIITKKYNYTRG